MHVGEFGDDRVGHIDRRSQSAHQRPEKLFSRPTRRPFDNVAQCAEIVANLRHFGAFPVASAESRLVHLWK